MYEITIDGMQKTIPCSCDQTLLRALTDAGIFLEANCGGKGTCGKCKVQILSGRVVGPKGIPLSSQTGNIYTACQVYPQQDITIALKHTEASTKGSMKAGLDDNGRPLLCKTVIAPEYPTLEKRHSLQEMICRACNAPERVAAAGIMRQLAEVAAAKASRITVVTMDDDVIAVEPGDTIEALFGVAIDIGTTTVAGMLVDINAQRIVATHSATNPQAAFGADVISRIESCSAPGGLEALATAIRRCLNEIIAVLCHSASILQDRVYAVVIAGNTTMGHLLLGISPRSLAVKPYEAVFRQIEPFSPNMIGLNVNSCGKVIMLPNIASFIGSDTTAAIVATDQDVSPTQLLLVDLGTNGEIVLGNRDKLWACATAAGPAFEGAHIRDGMRAATGAIVDVAIDNDGVRVQTIGDGKPAGICGSGLVKAIAELIKTGIIMHSGRFNTEAKKGLYPEVAERLRINAGHSEFVLVEAADSATGSAIAVTQADIRQVQLAKAAICTGIEILLDKAGALSSPQVLLAGAFGNYIDIDSALAIGLLPGVCREQIKPVGNAAGTGAVRALISREILARCERIAGEVAFVELAAQPDFQKMFLANLDFSR